MIKDWISLLFNILALPVITILLRSWIVGTNTRLDKMIEYQKDIAISDAVQNEKIKDISKDISGHNRRLNNHGKRIKKLESKK